MTKSTKQVLIAFGVLGLLCIVGVVVMIGIAAYFALDKDSSRDYEAKETEGREFGKTVDQRGCLQEGLARARKFDIFSVSPNASNKVFVRECLKSSRPTTGFCSGVPSSMTSDFTEWPKGQCKETQMDEVQTGCIFVFKEQVTFCSK